MKWNRILFLALLSSCVACQNKNKANENPADESQVEVNDQQENLKLTKNSIGPLKLGLPLADLPKSVSGLYDSYEKKHYDQSYDEFNGVDVPAYDEYEFYQNGEKVILATVDGDKIGTLEIFSPKIVYKGISAGMALREAIPSGLQIWTNASFQSCEEYLEFKVDDIRFGVRCYFTASGVEKTAEASLKAGQNGGLVQVELLPEDVESNSDVASIWLH